MCTRLIILEEKTSEYTPVLPIVRALVMILSIYQVTRQVYFTVNNFEIFQMNGCIFILETTVIIIYLLFLYHKSINLTSEP